MPENSSEVDVEGRNLRGSSRCPTNTMGDCGDHGSQRSCGECVDEANDTSMIVEEKQVISSSSSAVVEVMKDGTESQVYDKTSLDRDVDPALLAKIFVKGEESLNVGGMAKLAQNDLQSEVAENDARSEVNVTALGLDQFTSWEDSIVVGLISDYSVGNVSEVSSVVSDPTGLLGGNGSVFSKVPDSIAAQGKISSPPLGLEQASPCGLSLVATSFPSEREKPLLYTNIRGLATDKISGLGGEDVGTQCASNKIDEDQGYAKIETAQLNGLESGGIKNLRPTPQLTQEIDSRVCVPLVMPFSETRQQHVVSIEANNSCSLVKKDDELTTRLDNEVKSQEEHALLVHDSRIVTYEGVIVQTDASQGGGGQEVTNASSSVWATGVATGTAAEKELVDELLVVREAGDMPLPNVKDSKGKTKFQCHDVLDHRTSSCGGEVDELSGSMVEAFSVVEAAACDKGVNKPEHFTAVEAGNESVSSLARFEVTVSPVQVEARKESVSSPARFEVTVSPVQELTGPNMAGSEADFRVGNLASEAPVEEEKEEKEVSMEISEPKASVRDEGNDITVEEPVFEEVVLRDEIVMEAAPTEASPGGDYAVKGGLQIAEGFTERVQDADETEPELAKGSIDCETTTVGTVEGVAKGSDLDIVNNLVRNLCRKVSPKNEELSSEQITSICESPILVSATGFKASNSSSRSVAQNLEVPVVSDGFVRGEEDSTEWKKLILHGLKLLKCVAADIELKQKDTVSSIKGRTELHGSEELKGNRLNENLAQTTKTHSNDFRVEGHNTDFPIATEVENRIAVAGISSKDGGRSLGREKVINLKPSSKEAFLREEVKGVENPIISPQSPDKLELVVGCLADYAINQVKVAGNKISPTIAANYEMESRNTMVQEALEEGGPERKECRGSGDGSRGLGSEKFEMLVIPETTGGISDMQVPMADGPVEVVRHNVEQCSGGPQHSIQDDPKVVVEVVKARAGESDFRSLDPQREMFSHDPKFSLVATPGEKVVAAFRQDNYTIFDRSQSFWKSQADEISHYGDRVPSRVQPMISVEQILSVSSHESLPVAKRTLPVVANKEAASEKAMETTFFSSHPSADRKAPASIKGSSKLLGGYHEGECTSVDELTKEKSNCAGVSSGGVHFPVSSEKAGKHLSGGCLEDWDRLGVMSATDAIVTGDLAQITHVDGLNQDGKDSIKTSTIFLQCGDDPRQLMATEEGSVKEKIHAAVEAGGRDPTVTVKRKLQTKRKKFTGETECKSTNAAHLDPVFCSSLRVEAATSRATDGVVEGDVEMHGSEDLVRVLDEAGIPPVPAETSAVEQDVVLCSREADDVEAVATVLIDGDQTRALALMCHCAKPAVLKTVGHKSQNRGLKYYSCEKYKPTFFTKRRSRKRDIHNLTGCRFFQWLDSPRVSMEDRKEIRFQKKRHLEQILAAKAVTCNYSTRSSSKQELSEYDAHKSQGLLEGVPSVSGLSVEEPKHENSEEPEPSSKKQKLNKIDPSLSTADSVAFSTRASAARKRKGPCVVDTDGRSTPGNSSCGDESSHEVSVGDWTDSNPREVAKRVKSEGDKSDTPAHTYSRRGVSSRSAKRSGYILLAKNIGRLERATADTHHVRKLLPVALAYKKSREVVLEESSEEEVSGDQKEESKEENNSLQVSSSSEPLETPSSTSAEREQTLVKSRSQRASCTRRSGQDGSHTRSRGKLENSRRHLQKVRQDASGSETSLSGDLHNHPPQWIDVPLTSPFENKDCSKALFAGQQAVGHGVGHYGPLVGNHNLVVNFPTSSQWGNRRTISSNTLLLVKKKAREASLAVNLRRGKNPTAETESQRVACTKPSNRMKKRSEQEDVSDSDEEETGPSGSRGLRSLKDMLKRENGDGTMADYEVADESRPPYCECKTVKRRASLKTVTSNSENHGLRYWVCVNHRPLFQKKSLWEGDPNDESCKFFRWLDTPMISYSERKKQLAARRRRNERRGR